MRDLLDHRTPAQLRAAGGLKWNQYDDDVLAAWVAEMDFGLAPAVTEALAAAVERGDTGYPYPAAERDAAEAAVSLWADRLDWVVDPDVVFPVPDVVTGIQRAIMRLTRPGSAVVLHTPVYFPFFDMVDRAGRQLVEVASPVTKTGEFVLDLGGIGDAFAAGAGSIVLCNPWNPTGRVFRSDEVAAVVELAGRYDARVISDEIHGLIVYADVGLNPAAKSGDRADEVVVTVTAASKAWNLPGLKCAQVVLTNPEDAEEWRSYFTPEKVGVGTLGLFATAAAYRDGTGWLEEVMAHLTENRRLLDEAMPADFPAAGYRSPQATYLAWLDFSAYGLDDPSGFFLKHAKVALTSGTPFGSGGRGRARLNFATSTVILEEILERMSAVLPPV